MEDFIVFVERFSYKRFEHMVEDGDILHINNKKDNYQTE
jgi:hypothetical protein